MPRYTRPRRSRWCKDFRVRELGGRAALARLLLLLKPIVGEAENGCDEGALRSMERDPLYAWAAWGTTAHSGGLALFSTLQRNLHTGLAKVYTPRLGIEASS